MPFYARVSTTYNMSCQIARKQSNHAFLSCMIWENSPKSSGSGAWQHIFKKWFYSTSKPLPRHIQQFLGIILIFKQFSLLRVQLLAIKHLANSLSVLSAFTLSQIKPDGFSPKKLRKFSYSTTFLKNIASFRVFRHSSLQKDLVKFACVSSKLQIQGNLDHFQPSFCNLTLRLSC